MVNVMIRGRGVSRDLAEFPLLGELSSELAEVLHDVLAGCDEGFLGRDLAVRLHAQLELGEQRVRHLVTGEGHVRRRQKARPQEVAERMVFFFEQEDGTGRDSWGRV